MDDRIPLRADESHTLRRLVAAIAYRSARVLKDVQQGYPDFSPGNGVRPPREIVSHMSSVLAYAYGRLSDTKRIRHDLADWDTERDRFYGKLESIDDAIATGAALNEGELDQLLQGPFADVLTHIGQLAMMRRMCGAPVPGENYFLADIQIGCVSIEQADPAVPDPATEK